MISYASACYMAKLVALYLTSGQMPSIGFENISVFTVIYMNSFYCTYIVDTEKLELSDDCLYLYR
jgi:hypothetical protein